MNTAHVVGMPVEELIPLAAGGGAVLFVARTWIVARLSRRRDDG